MKAAAKAKRWNDVSIAELVFFEKLGSYLHASRSSAMVQVSKAVGFTNAHCHNTLAKLEGKGRFNKQLVNRQTVTLTKDGEEVLVYARRVLESYRLRPFESGRTTLRIAATNRVLTTLLASHFPDFIAAYRAKTKTDLNVEILEATFEQVLSWLETGEVELAFGGVNISENSHSKLAVEANVSYPKLEAETLREKLRMVLVAPSQGIGEYTKKAKNDGLKASMKSLGAINLCLIRRDLRGDFSKLPAPSEGCMRIIVDNYSSVLAMVRAQAAVGLMIDQGISSDLLKFSFSDTNLCAQNFAVWHRKGVDLSDAAIALKQSLRTRKTPRIPRKN